MNIISALACLIGFFQLQFVSGTDQVINLGAFQGRKVLLVNIATESRHQSQLLELQQLQHQYADKLVVLAFPSDSFGNEPKSDIEIANFCHTKYGVSFPIAKKGAVMGNGISPVFAWLASEEQNGVANITPSADFFKVLIGEDGEVKAMFSPQVLPTDSLVIEAIQTP